MDYTTSYQDANDKSRAARAKMTGGLKATTGGAGLRATNWTLGLDDNKAEGHYTSQTMKVGGDTSVLHVSQRLFCCVCLFLSVSCAALSFSMLSHGPSLCFGVVTAFSCSTGLVAR